MPKQQRTTSPRVQVSLAKGVYDTLVAYAEQNGFNLSTACSYLIQSKLEDLQREGLLEIKPDKALEKLLEAMLSGVPEKDIDFQKIGKALNRDPKELEQAYKKIKFCEE